MPWVCFESLQNCQRAPVFVIGKIVNGRSPAGGFSPGFNRPAPVFLEFGIFRISPRSPASLAALAAELTETAFVCRGREQTCSVHNRSLRRQPSANYLANPCNAGDGFARQTAAGNRGAKGHVAMRRFPMPPAPQPGHRLPSGLCLVPVPPPHRSRTRRQAQSRKCLRVRFARNIRHVASSAQTGNEGTFAIFPAVDSGFHLRALAPQRKRASCDTPPRPGFHSPCWHRHLG